MTPLSQSLSDRMAAGRIPVVDAFRIGMQLAEQLRQLHDQEMVHGALTPSVIELIGESVLLVEASEPASEPYAAPEVLDGAAPDYRSDVYSFGAILLEMLTGSPEFEGTTGSPPVDRLMRACMATSPDGRFQRIQKMMLELKMLAAAARRGNVPAPVSPNDALLAQESTASGDVAPSGQLRDLESRIAARLAAQEKSVASVAQVANEVLKALQQQQRYQAPPPAPAPEPAPRARMYAEPMDGYSSSRLDKTIDLLADKLSRIDLVVSSLVERLQKLEDAYESFDTDAAALRDSVTRDVRSVERAIKAQHTAIESARTAMGQTDDLVERVVEALDSLQSMFVTGVDDQRSMAS